MNGLDILLVLCRLTGLSHLKFVEKSGKFESDNGVMLIYWVVLNVVYLLLLPCINVVFLWSITNCQTMDILAVAYSVACLPSTCLTLILLSGSWRFRSRFSRLANQNMAFQKLYRRDLAQFGYGYWMRHVAKIVFTSSRVLLLINLLFGPDSLLMCGRINIASLSLEMSTMYILVSLSMLLMELMNCFADYWLYYTMGISNWVLDSLSKEAQDLRQDLRYLPLRQGCHRLVYQQQLLSGWQQLWQCCLRLNSWNMELLSLYRWQILFNLFTRYLLQITNVFRLIVDANKPVLLLCTFAYSCVLCVLAHFDLMMYFSVFEANHLRWRKLRERLEKIWLTLSSMDIDWTKDTHCIALYRKLEFALIFLNRKLQRRPERTRNLHVLGLFDMSRKSGFRMTGSIVMNVLFLFQIAYKNYY